MTHLSPIGAASAPRRHGLTRRDSLRVGSLGALGLSLFEQAWLRRDEAGSSGAGTGSPRLWAAPPRNGKFGQAKACILLWLDGGPSHLETFDLKPDTPSEVRGPFQPIATRAPGVTVCELLPKTAQVADKLAIVRSLTSPLGEHGLANQYLLTGYKPSPVLDYPSFGAVLAHERGGEHTLPPYIAVPDYRPQSGSGFLGPAYRPFAVGSDPARPDFQVRDLEFYPGVTAGRLERRRQFLAQLDQWERIVESAAPPRDPGFAQAYRLITSNQAKEAFDLTQESAATRERYGPRTFGQSCLLARRLVERGVGLVAVNYIGWDTHESLVLRLKEGYTGAKVGVGLLPILDQGLAALVSDLEERGLLDETLVVVMGEFGRTPKLNTRGGRDHWPRVFSAVLAGGGVAGGQVIGKSDPIGESPADEPVTPADLAFTIYSLLGVDPGRELHTNDGRPILINQGGQAIRGILS